MKTKRIFSMLLALALVFTLLPASALAKADPHPYATALEAFFSDAITDEDGRKPRAWLADINGDGIDEMFAEKYSIIGTGATKGEHAMTYRLCYLEGGALRVNEWVSVTAETLWLTSKGCLAWSGGDYAARGVYLLEAGELTRIDAPYLDYDYTKEPPAKIGYKVLEGDSLAEVTEAKFNEFLKTYGLTFDGHMIEVGTDRPDETAKILAMTTDAAPGIPVPGKVVVSSQPLQIDGGIAKVQPYNIDGANYFKLRDLAALLTGTGSQFNVGFENGNIVVTTGEEYKPIDGDLAIGEDRAATTRPSPQTLVVDGKAVEMVDGEILLVYNIGGSNYFQLRQLGALVGFSVEYDAETRTIIVETVL